MDSHSPAGNWLKGITFLLAFIVAAVGLCLMVSVIRELRTPNYNFRGTHYDFLAFYTAASTILHHNVHHLYDLQTFTDFQRQIIPHPVGALGYMPFLNPPFVAVVLAPLALFNITDARLIWLVVTILLSIFVLYHLTKPLAPKSRLLAISLLLITFPMYQTFIEGQLSIFILLGGTLSYLFFTQHKKLLSGASLVLLWILPQFAVFALIGLVLKRQWQMLKGWLIASLSVALITLPVTGLKIYFSYLRLLASTTSNHFVNMATSAQLTWRGALNLSDGINGFYSALLGENHLWLTNALYLITAVVLVGFIVKMTFMLGSKYSKEQAAYLFAAAVLTAILIDPHLFAQDVIVIYLILPAIYILFKQYSLRAIIALAIVCDLVWLDQRSKVHFFTIIMFGSALYFATQAMPKIKKMSVIS